MPPTPPAVPPLPSLNPGPALEEGQGLTLAASCTAEGSPAPNVTWDTEVKGLASSRSFTHPRSAAVTSEFHLVPSRSMNGQPLTCVVAHPGLLQSRRLTHTLQVACECSGPGVAQRGAGQPRSCGCAVPKAENGVPSPGSPAGDGLAAFSAPLYQGGRPASWAVGRIRCTGEVKCFCETHSSGCGDDSGRAWVLLWSLVSLCQQSEPTLQRGDGVGQALSACPAHTTAARVAVAEAETKEWAGPLGLAEPGHIPSAPAM